MNSTLSDTLVELARPGAEPNAAFDRLLADYARFHLALAIGALALTIISGGFGLLAWRRRRLAPKPGRGRWTFERAVWSAGALCAAGFGATMAVLAAANLSTALDPLPGFRGSIGMLAVHAPGSRADRIQVAYQRWLASGSRTMPEGVRSAVDGRLSWQRPKAIICAVLLVAALTLCRRLWRSTLACSGGRPGRSRSALFGMTLAAVSSSALVVVLVLMVLGNTQASLAPISMTMFLG